MPFKSSADSLGRPLIPAQTTPGFEVLLPPAYSPDVIRKADEEHQEHQRNSDR